jgi:CheY-like chemotaxis protein
MQRDTAFLTVVLIADNNDDHYLPMEETLLQEGYVVERVRSSEDAMLRCSAPPPVHIALVDASLPGKNGHLLTQQPRPAGHPPLTFILMSGFSMAAVSLALAWGCKEFLSKPVGREELLAVVKKWRHAGIQTQTGI